MARTVVQVWICVFIIVFQGISSPVQSQYSCSYRCFDPNLEIEVGDIFTWYGNNYLLSSSIPNDRPSTQDRFLISIEMEVLKPLNNLTRNQFRAHESEYLQITATVTEDGNNTYQESFFLAKLVVLLISPTLAMGDDQPINSFLDQATKDPEEDIDIYSPKVAGFGSITLIGKIYRWVDGGHYFEKSEINMTDVNEDVTTEWREVKTVEINMNTGLLINYDFTVTDLDGNLLRFVQISDDLNSVLSVVTVSLDFDFPIILIFVMMGVVVLTFLIYIIRKNQ